MERIGMQADLVTEIADFLERVPHARRAVPILVESVAVHGEEQSAHAECVQNARDFDRTGNVAVNVEFQVAEFRVLAWAEPAVSVVIGAIAFDEFVDRQECDTGLLKPLNERLELALLKLFDAGELAKDLCRRAYGFRCGGVLPHGPAQ
jgi:hypothetical protein